MKILKIFKKKKRKKLTNKFQVGNYTNFYWELLEENNELKKRLEELENGKKNKNR